MTERKLHILHVEDRLIFRTLVEICLISSDLDYELTSLDNRASAIKFLNEVAEGKEECDVAALDGQIEPNSRPGEDAQILSQKIKEDGLEIVRIGVGAEMLRLFGVEVDYDLGKENIAELPDLIKKHFINAA